MQAVMTDVVLSPTPVIALFLLRICGSAPTDGRFFHRVLLTHALALSTSQIVHKKKPTKCYTRTNSGGFELTKLTYTRLEDNLLRHRGSE